MITTYVCDKCSLRWLTEVNKCINCNSTIKILIGKSLKVIGITKIFNPSTTHPDTPYYVVLTKDEHGSVRPFKTKAEYKIGERFTSRKISAGDRDVH